LHPTKSTRVFGFLLFSTLIAMVCFPLSHAAIGNTSGLEVTDSPAADLTALWTHDAGSSVFSSPALRDVDQDPAVEVIVGTSDGTLLCIDGASGSLEWSFQAGDSIDSSPSVADVDGDGDDEIVFGSDDHSLYCLTASNGSLEWSRDLGGPVRSTPTIVDVDANGDAEVLIGSGNNTMFCLRGVDGSKVWSFETQGPIEGTATVGHALPDTGTPLMVLFGSTDGCIYGLDAASGDLEWYYTTNAPVRSGPVMLEVSSKEPNIVIVGSDDGGLYCIRVYDGTLEWSFATNASIRSSLGLGGLSYGKIPWVIFGSDDGAVYCVTPDHGRLVWHNVLGDQVRSSPTIADIDGDDRLDVVVGCNDGRLYCLDSSGSVIAEYSLNSAVQSSPVVLDIDDNGKSEIVVSSDEGTIYALQSGGVRVYWEALSGDTEFRRLCNEWAGDPDCDLLSSYSEPHFFTSPSDPDSDSDGMVDGWEIGNGLQPLASDAQGDPDEDRLTNGDEFLAGCDPHDNDTDDDGLSDYSEVFDYWSNPANPDTDGDGMPDGYEAENDLSVISNDANDDRDGDGLTNIEEYRLGTNPRLRDTDGDGVSDGEEVRLGSDPLVVDHTPPPDFEIVAKIAVAGGVFLVPFLCIVVIVRTIRSRRASKGPTTAASVPAVSSTRAASEPSRPVEAEPELGAPTGEGVVALRGCAVVGGRFEYKVKVKNDTPWVITNVTVTILSYPEDCMELEGPSVKTIKRIGPGEFRSPQFVFLPTKDCVEGSIVATVSYLDHQNKAHTIEVEPYVIRSVCDLLMPLESTLNEFDSIIRDMDVTSEERVLPWNPKVLFSKVKAFLPARNFHIVEAREDTVGGIFTGTIKGLAEGKYTGKKVAVRILITGPADANEAKTVIEGLGEDVAMLPTTVTELSERIDAWTCLRCGALLSPSQVQQIKSGSCVECSYCGASLSLDLYKA